jgi:hypothetical protein
MLIFISVLQLLQSFPEVEVAFARTLAVLFFSCCFGMRREEEVCLAVKLKEIVGIRL